MGLSNPNCPSKTAPLSTITLEAGASTHVFGEDINAQFKRLGPHLTG